MAAIIIRVSHSTENPSTGNAVGVVVAGLVPALIILGCARLAMPQLRRRGLVQVARPTRGDSRDQGPLPSASLLLSFGTLLGEDRLSNEGDSEYIRRIFGVTQTASEDG